MPLHQKIIHHLHKHKENILAHVKNHKKKYIFGAGISSAIGILGVIMITGVYLGINMMVGRSQAMDEEMKVYEKIAIFNVIDDFMHQRFSDISMKNNPATAEIDKVFPVIDAAYHNAKNLNEKYKAAKTMVDFITKGRDIVRNLGYTTPNEDIAFDAMIFQFHKIQE